MHLIVGSKMFCQINVYFPSPLLPQKGYTLSTELLFQFAKNKFSGDFEL